MRRAAARLAGAALVALAAFSAANACAAPAAALTVFAAASLKTALDDVDAAYRARHPANIVVSYAASSALAKQIENGAPADVFVSADLEWMDYLAARKLLRPGSRVNLLRNELVLIAPAASRLSIAIAPGFPLAAELGNGRLAIADPDHVPAGKYAKAALEKLRVWSSVANRLARAENVRAALVFVARGEAPLGIVYRTDAAAERNVRVVATFPANTHPPIVYPAAIAAASRNSDAATYLAFLGSTEAAEIFKRRGFMAY